MLSPSREEAWLLEQRGGTRGRAGRMYTLDSGRTALDPALALAGCVSLAGYLTSWVVSALTFGWLGLVGVSHGLAMRHRVIARVTREARSTACTARSSHQHRLSCARVSARAEIMLDLAFCKLSVRQKEEGMKERDGKRFPRHPGGTFFTSTPVQPQSPQTKADPTLVWGGRAGTPFAPPPLSLTRAAGTREKPWVRSPVCKALTSSHSEDLKDVGNGHSH